MDPPVTMLPSKRLTPSRCELLSRPLRELPCPFLCAMAIPGAASAAPNQAGRGACRAKSSNDLFDAHPRERAAMSLRTAHALPALLLEDSDFRTARFAIDDADYLDVRHEGGAGEHLTAVLLQEQDAIDADLVARLGINPVDFDDGAGRDLDLAAAALNDCEHLYRPLLAGAKP